ncbi:hypothetical protein VTP01DRAFT_2053 [Rhizomucor pusillus]|uniref:uncharacterized protein n=1 Tax=Rhizomucor pusillus TaxID=4840 RepID=UPI00374357A3
MVAFGSPGAAIRAQNERRALNNNLAGKVGLVTGNIAVVHADVIVTATNRHLTPGGAVNNAVHMAAGPELYQKLEEIRYCEPGDAKITDGFNSPARFIISTVGPTNQDRRILASCYQKCMELCELHNARTIVFPCIATGAFGFDHETAANIALSNVRAYLERNLVSGKDSFDKVLFCTYTANDQSIYSQLLPVYFPSNGLEQPFPIPPPI